MSSSLDEVQQDSVPAVANPSAFRELGLPESVQAALDAVGYETPSPIQAATIPKLLQGGDLLGQAQTGTGKTAAFALPILSSIDLERREPQAIVLAPTRELAIQVAEAFQKYAACMPGFQVLPIYGGQAYPLQLRPLKRGVHVVVGTPGRVIDHLERGSLDLSSVKHFVLDEADEMLNMGFVEEVDKVLARAPQERQIVLFSATMPPPIQKLAETYMRDPEVVRMESKIQIAETVRQRFLIVKGNLKLDSLTRILEAETFDAMLVFVRTKSDTVELSEKLEARGHASAPLNGDVPQKLREQTVERLKRGKLDIIVATDVAARGLDVPRISHVLNYDMPTGIEPYTHRIGRTGRAGRQGEAIIFVKPQERRILSSIQRATGRELEAYSVPTTDEVNASRIERFKERIKTALQSGPANTDLYGRIMREVVEESGAEHEKVFAVLAEMVQGDRPLLFEATGRQDGRERSDEERERFQGDRGFRSQREQGNRRERFQRDDRRERYERGEIGGQRQRDERVGKFDRFDKKKPGPQKTTEPGMIRYRVEVGYQHGAKPGSIVGAIANEGDISSEFIGRIEIYDRFSTIDLPEGMPKETFERLQFTRIRGQQLRLAKFNEDREGGSYRSERSGAKPGFKPGFKAGFKSGLKPGKKPGFKPGGGKFKGGKPKFNKFRGNK